MLRLLQSYAISGFSGYSGASGRSGYSGTSGFSSNNPGVSGASGFSGIAGSAAYGQVSLFNNSTSTSLPSQNAYVQLGYAWTAGDSLRTTIASNPGTITANENGEYVVSVSMACYGSSANTYRVAAFKNGTIIPGIVAQAFVQGTNGNVTTPLSATGIVSLNASDIIDLRASCVTASSVTFTPVSAVLSVSLVGQEVGNSGYSGLSGFSSLQPGVSGTSGFSGQVGPQGASGFSGLSGFSSQSGTSGFSSNSGTSGFSGQTGGSVIIAKTKTSAETRTSATPTLDSQLVVTLPAGNYAWECWLMVTASNLGPGIYLSMTGTATTSQYFGFFSSDNGISAGHSLFNVGSLASPQYNSANVTGTSYTTIRVTGGIVVSSPGTFGLIWCQNGSDPSHPCTLMAASWLCCWPTS